TLPFGTLFISVCAAPFPESLLSAFSMMIVYVANCRPMYQKPLVMSQMVSLKLKAAQLIF
ncbi:MAG: hypothetical protein AB8G95_26515, partial [Anaerolineae bacterium]